MKIGNPFTGYTALIGMEVLHVVMFTLYLAIAIKLSI